jgi:hypothetical protein
MYRLLLLLLNATARSGALAYLFQIQAILNYYSENYRNPTNTINVTRGSNFASEWLALLLRIRKVLGSSLCPETDYKPLRFSWFSSVPSGKFSDSNLNQAMISSFHILPNSLIILSFDAIQSELLTVSLNES